jgi:benzoyl-CoA reductase/2-hydroxyglutaryl-CoA dehydratase subunit BcrC/BadD/HgdB
MEQSGSVFQAGLLRDYYKYFSKYAKGKKPDKKVAWVTAFTPVEILETLDMYYYYPESYAAVIAASNKEQPLIRKSGEMNLSGDCCSYSCCMEGCLELEQGPRGIPPVPDVLIATNNQCNTLPNWWNIMARRFNVPLIVLDYPGESTERNVALEYVTKQHIDLINKLQELTGNTLDMALLQKIIDNSRQSVVAWECVRKNMYTKNIDPTMLFDGINFLITARCKSDTAQLYKILNEDMKTVKDADESLIPLFWLGYPLWYHPKRYSEELLDGCRICGSNYVSWWSLDYSGEDAYEQLFSAYNYTFLNLSQKTRNEKLSALVKESGAKGAVVLHNKSCKCDFVSARNIDIPQAELEIDMIDRTFMDEYKAGRQIELLKEILG